jgi:hypothetical protein
LLRIVVFGLVSLLTIGLVSCGITSVVDEEEEEVDETLLQTKTIDYTLTNLKGKFESKKGVMNPISCYGFNIGFLKLPNGNEYVVCFDQLKNSNDLDVNCVDEISVIGEFESKTIKSNGACPAGTMEIFYVKDWECK